LILVLLHVGSGPDQPKLVDNCAAAQIDAYHKDAGHVSAGIDVILQMPRHRPSVVGDQNEAVVIAPHEDVGIKRAGRRRADRADASDRHFPVPFEQAAPNRHVDILVQKIAD
jgi:hypothetical protein